MIKDILLVGIGGFSGSIARYLVSVYLMWNSNYIFPFATLTVNLLGSLIIGFLAGIFIKSQYHPYQLLLLTGFCGGFTTFSTFSFEGIKLLKASLYGHYMGYVASSIIGGLILCFLGVWLSEKLT